MARHERLPGGAFDGGTAELLAVPPHHLRVAAAPLAVGAGVGAVVEVLLLLRPRGHRVPRLPGGARGAQEHVDAVRRRRRRAVVLELGRPPGRPVRELLRVPERLHVVHGPEVRVVHVEVLTDAGLEQPPRHRRRARGGGQQDDADQDEAPREPAAAADP